MKTILKRLIVSTLIAFCFVSAPSWAEDKTVDVSALSCDQKTDPNHMLFWGSDSTSNVPYVFHNSSTGKVEGFENDIMQALAKDLNLKPCFIQNGWEGLIPGLTRGSYQAVADGIEITNTRKKKMLFSEPYLVSTNRIVVPEHSQNIQTLDDLKKGRIGTIKSSNAERILEEHKLNVRTYDEETALFSDLRAGRLKAALVDAPIAQYYQGADLKMVGQPVGEISYGIALAPYSKDLQAKLNKGLEDIIHNGQLARILYSWNLVDTRGTGPEALTDTPHEAWNAYKAAQKTNQDKSFSAFVKRYAGLAPTILHGAWITLLVSFVSMLIAVLVGALLVLGRLYGPKWIKLLSLGFIEIWRGTPLLIQLLFIFYGLPELGIALPPFVAGVIALGMNYSAYEAENYRNALASIPVAQKDAARALNFNRWQILRWVLAPQAIPRVIPIMTNDFIALLKDSSLVSIITLTDLTQVYVRISSTYYDYLGAGVVIGLVYLVIGMPFVRLAHKLEDQSEVLLNPHH